MSIPSAPAGLSFRRRSQLLVGGAALAVAIVAASLAIAWPRPRAKEPASEPVAVVATPATAEDEEEERPDAAPPEPADPPTSAAEEPPADDPPQPVQPPTPPPAPIPSPGDAAPRRGPVALDTLTEDELRQQLAGAREVGLTPPELPPLVNSWAANFTVDFETRGDISFGPAVLLRARPDLAALPIRTGRASRIGGSASAELQRLSQRLHALLDLTAPTDLQGHRADPAVLRRVLREEHLGRKPLWLRPEAVPTLMQLLMHEGEAVRALLVELLADIDGRPATVALARRAVFDLSADVRRQAVEALHRRSPADARPTFLDALRYPWAPPADHAAEALVKLADRDSVPYLVTLLKEPTPVAPFPVGKDRWAMREVVALRHVNNCLTCHPPASRPGEPVPGNVPNVTIPVLVRGSAGASAGGGGGGGYGGGGGSSSAGAGMTRVDLPVSIRADITYLRQDFSVQQSVPLEAAPLRFDYMVRTRLLTSKELRELHRVTDDLPTYPQREAVLHALRELTGRDAGPTTAAWEALYPGADLEARTGRLTLELLGAEPVRQNVLIARYRDGKGVAYTDALAGAVPRLPPETGKKAREALASRLTRMTPKTMRRKLADDDPEVRRAAAEACRRLGERQYVPDLAELLEDGEPAVRQAAGAALEGLTGRQHSTAEEWRSWWESQRAE
jgi:HEAT repeat protein